MAESLHQLLISCEDRPGIVAAVSGFLAGKGANIVVSDQHSTDAVGGRGRGDGGRAACFPTAR